MTKILNNFFKLKENNTDVRTEFIAGVTTFMTMAYILVVNPSILSAAGMDSGAVFTATALSSIIATLIMGLYAKLPFAQAPGMGLNAFFAYTVVLSMGYSYQFALTAVLLEGLIFVLLTVFNVREAIVDSIPMNIKRAISVGIGLFIALLGLEAAGVVVHPEGGGTIVSLGNITSGTGLLAIIGIVITGILVAKKVKGALFLGMIITAVIGIPMGVIELPEKIFSMPPSISSTFMSFEWSNIFSLDMVIVLFTLLFMDMFDTIGTLVGVATKANMLDKDGKVPNIKKALLADAVGTTVGACLGTSTVSTFVESASGVAEGGRTGLTAVIGIPMGVIDLPNKIFSMPPSISSTFMQFEWHNIFSWDMVIVLFTLLFMDMFDTIGTLVGVATKANMLDKDGKVPNIKKALLADAVGTTVGACLGTSTVSTFVESASGVAEGGRTGLTAVSTAFMFFLALFLSPIFGVVTSAVTASVLVIVGLFMIECIKEIDLEDYTEAIPAFLTIIMMPFSYSISDGIVFGVVSYIFLKIFTKRWKEVSLATVAVGVVFVLKFILI